MGQRAGPRDQPVARAGAVGTRQPRQLEGLRRNSNQLSGSIPRELGNLANLRELWLHSNQLSGPIPPELGNLANLETLGLGSNQFSGCVLAELLDVSDNDVAGLGLPFC